MGAVSVTKSAAASWGQSLQHLAFLSAPREQRPLTPLIQHIKRRLRPPPSLPLGHQGNGGVALSYVGACHPPGGPTLLMSLHPHLHLPRHRHRDPVLPSCAVPLHGQTVQPLCTPRDSPPLVTLSSLWSHGRPSHSTLTFSLLNGCNPFSSWSDFSPPTVSPPPGSPPFCSIPPGSCTHQSPLSLLLELL